MSSIRMNQDDDAIVHLTFSKPDAALNLMDSAFIDDFIAVIAQLQKLDFTGIILQSDKSSFFAGGDLDQLSQLQPNQGSSYFAQLTALKKAMRWLETNGKPVVACINGAALGGGWELALASHYRIALDEGVILGLPEVTLGLVPGAGGVVRMTRLLGLKRAFPFLLEGKRCSGTEGFDIGLIHRLADSPEAMQAQARSWILAQRGVVSQPYDRTDFSVPGGDLDDANVVALIALAPAQLRLKTHGTLPAPEAVLAVMVESLRVDIDTALKLETRYFIKLATSQIAKNMITTFWHQLNQLKAGASRPPSQPNQHLTQVGVIGAGMMGAGIAYALANNGIKVVLQDVQLEKAVFAKSYSATILTKRISRGQLADNAVGRILQRITPTSSSADLRGCEMIIEAVFEDRGIKAAVTKQALQAVGDDVIMASNTSTLPISSLAKASSKPERFIGLHFFSPVEKMPLVEIIKGKLTDDETLAAVYDLVLQMGKVPIVVNDGRGFFTSRVFSAYTHEGMRMLAEGVPAAVIENGASQAGFPVGPLALVDEVSLSLLDKIRVQTRADLSADDKPLSASLADQVLDVLLAHGRKGKLTGAGFYDYPNRAKKHLWPQLTEIFPVHDDWHIDTVKERLLFVQSLEALRAYQEGVVTSCRDANIGSIMGLGFPIWTGGVLQLVNHYGVEQFNQRAQQLCEQFGEQFAVPQILNQWSSVT